jgi:hypothetical protein
MNDAVAALLKKAELRRTQAAPDSESRAQPKSGTLAGFHCDVRQSVHARESV